MPPSPKDVLSTGKVLWVESNGVKSSPVRFVLEGTTIYVLVDGAHESLPPIDEGETVELVGHPLSKQTMAGRAQAVAHLLGADSAPKGVVLELAGTKYDGSLSPDENYEALSGKLELISFEFV